MTYNELQFPSGVRELTTDECCELAASRPVGRISYCSESGPVTLPLNHVVVGQDILIRTSPDSDLGRQLIQNPRVCFEVDDFDEYYQSGWSVLIQGQATVVEPQSAAGDSDAPNPWLEGDKTLHVLVRSDLVTGRRVVGS